MYIKAVLQLADTPEQIEVTSNALSIPTYSPLFFSRIDVCSPEAKGIMRQAMLEDGAHDAV